LLLFGYSAAFGQSGVQEEWKDLIEAAKADDAATRQKAVAELLNARAVIGSELGAAIRDVATDETTGGPKATALYLGGALGLPECYSGLQENSEWKWDDPEVREPDRRERQVSGAVGRRAWYAAGFPDPLPFTIRTTTTLDSIESYPVLEKALVSAREIPRASRRQAEVTILEWYKSVCEGLSTVLSVNEAGKHSNDVKITAAFVLGELRTRDPSVLVENAGLHDSTGIAARYGEVMNLGDRASVYPCVDALLKSEKRSELNTTCLLVTNDLESALPFTNDDRQRVLGVLALTAPNETSRLLTSWRDNLRNATPEELVERELTEAKRTAKLEILNDALTAILEARSKARLSPVRCVLYPSSQ
jgi:hypothetical protein